MTPEQRHDLIKRRKAQLKRLETKAKALRTRIAKAKRSIAGLERAQAKAGVDPAAIEAEREQAKDMAMLESFVGKPKKPRKEHVTHFVFHNDDQTWRSRPGDFGHEQSVRVRRKACYGYVAVQDGRAMRLGTDVTCPKCMELKAAWIAQSRRLKPLTIRRAEALRKTMAAPAQTPDAVTPAGPVEHKTTSSLDLTQIELRLLGMVDKRAAFRALYGGRS